MSQIRKCYNENCENNYMGAYCECCEITIDENGCCCSYFPKQEEEDEIESCGGHDVDYQPVTYGTYLGLKYAKSLVETAETADVQKVRHGHWIEDKETGCLICSECGRFTDEIIGDMIEQDGKIIHRSMNPFYCSKCGAKMDGKE